MKIVPQKSQPHLGAQCSLSESKKRIMLPISGAGPALLLLLVSWLPDSSLAAPNKFNLTYEQRDLAGLLEGHRSHSLVDPRGHLTGERIGRAMVSMSRELAHWPGQLRLAQLVRSHYELGRKTGSKLNQYASRLLQALDLKPDALGNKPNPALLSEALTKAFESKNDEEAPSEDGSLESRLQADEDLRASFNASLLATASEFGRRLCAFSLESLGDFANSLDGEELARLAELLGDALKRGLVDLVAELEASDKFRVAPDVVGYGRRWLTVARAVFQRRLIRLDRNATLLAAGEPNEAVQAGPLSESEALIGPWNNYLFAKLGTSERVVKLFAGLLARVPPAAKARWTNAYLGQARTELERTLSGFVQLQALGPVDSEPRRLLMPRKSAQSGAVDRDRIPARCYLAGRRWRLLLAKASLGWSKYERLVDAFASRVAALRAGDPADPSQRLCLPRLELGLRGLSIQGEPLASKPHVAFPLRSPISGLDALGDPFEAGARLGFRLGAKIGYNEQRNASLELEQPANSAAPVQLDYLVRSSQRRANTEAARQTLGPASREGFLAALQLSLRAGILIPTEQAASSAAGTAAGPAQAQAAELARNQAESYLLERPLDEAKRGQLLQQAGEAADQAAAKTARQIGALVAREAAGEAYRRALVRGASLDHLRFQLDEFRAGLRLAFEYGLDEGRRIAASAALDPSAPRFFRFPEPNSKASDVDHWEKDLIPAATDKLIERLQTKRGHTLLSGTLKGRYTQTKESRRGLERLASTNSTYVLRVTARGFIYNNVTYLSLNGTLNNLAALKGSFIADDISANKDS